MLQELKPIEVRPRRRLLWIVGIVAAVSVALLVVFSIAIAALGAVGY